MNQRPPQYIGRGEIECLLSSGYPNDWVKISEMFLGNVPEDFVFHAKHKSNAYGSEGGGDMSSNG
jgi:tRNA-dihydrouridine synthase 3